MTNYNDFKATNSYFAAANSYDGFISYFGSVFDPKEYTRLFILKGGPGTGKSSIMKRIYTTFEELGCCCEAIYCSSDVHSLDGVIVVNERKRIAVIDGTAPHQTDASLPGAYDTLINLGEAWREDMLIAEKSRIKELNKLKSSAYSSAYDNLILSSIFSRKIKAEIFKIYDKKRSSIMTDEFCAKLSADENGLREIRLISSFSKEGLTTLPTLVNICDNIYSIYGIYGSGGIFMRELAEKLSKTNTDLCLFPTPLDKDIYEAIYIKSTKTAVILQHHPDGATDVSDLLDIKKLSEIQSDILAYEATKSAYTEKAKQYFSLASEYHFSLEAIYTPAMDFNKLELITDSLIEKCKKLLFDCV